MNSVVNGMTVLVGEDEPEVRGYLEMSLKCLGYSVEFAEDGHEVLKTLRKSGTSVDAVLLDLIMPNCDGFQLAEAVKARPLLALIPLIFVTAFAQRTEIEEGYRRGAVSYLIKPFSPADLRAKIEAFVPVAH